MGRRNLEGALMGKALLPALLLTGCSSLHLHNETEAARARAAVAAWEKVDLDATTTTALANVEALTAAERDTHRKLNELGFQIDLAVIIDTAPGTGETGQALGWNKLLEETDAALAPFGLSIDEARPSEESKIKYADANQRDFQDELDTFNGMAADFKEFNEDPPTLDWKKMLAPGPELDRLLEEKGIRDGDADEYRNLAGNAAELRRLKARPRPGFTVPGTDLDLWLHTTEVRGRVKTRKAEIQRLSKSYRAAKKALADAEKKLASSQDESALSALEGKVREKLAAVVAIVEDAGDVPLVGPQLRTDALTGVIQRFDGLGSEDSVASALLGAVATDPEVAARLGLSQRPPIHSLVLELAVQQMAYEQAVATQTWEQRELQLLEAMLESQERSLRSWISVAHKVREKRRHESAAVASKTLPQTDLDRIRGRPLDEYFAKATPEMKQSVIEALAAYGTAVAHGEHRLRELDVERRSALRLMAIERSDVAMTAWSAVVGAPLRALAEYHEGGLSWQEVAEFLQAVGLGAVAVGVN